MENCPFCSDSPLIELPGTLDCSLKCAKCQRVFIQHGAGQPILKMSMLIQDWRRDHVPAYAVPWWRRLMGEDVQATVIVAFCGCTAIWLFVQFVDMK